MLLVFVAGLVCAQTLDDYQRRHRELVVAYLKPLKRRPCWVRNKIEHLLSLGGAGSTPALGTTDLSLQSLIALTWSPDPNKDRWV
jgi:hypothetical protein